MPTGGFKELHIEFVMDTDALLARFNQPFPNSGPYGTTCPPVHDDARSLLVVYLQNYWGTYCLNILEISAEGKHPTLAGRQLEASPEISVYCSAAQVVRKAARKVADAMKYCNPVWHSPEFTSKVAAELKVENYQAIFYALSSTIIPKRVTDVRNYVVHHRDENRAKFIQVAAAEGHPGADIGPLLRARQVGGVTLFERWVQELRVTAERAAT